MMKTQIHLINNKKMFDIVKDLIIRQFLLYSRSLSGSIKLPCLFTVSKLKLHYLQD